MFLVKDGKTLVFLEEDPRDDGFDGEVFEGVNFEGLALEETSRWPGQPELDVVGYSPEAPMKYKQFRSSQDCAEQGYTVVEGTPVVYGRWAEYLQKNSDLQWTHSKSSVLERTRLRRKSTRRIVKR
jgi:hypothetical protein